MMRSYQADKTFGIAKEAAVLEKLQKYFTDEEHIVSTSEYCVFDYESKSGSTWEVKSRRCKKNAYPTTICPVAKIRQTENKQILVFNFLDTCSYILYDKATFKKFNIAPVSTNRYGKNDEPKDHYFIPVGELIDIVFTNIPTSPSGSEASYDCYSRGECEEQYSTEAKAIAECMKHRIR